VDSPPGRPNRERELTIDQQPRTTFSPLLDLRPLGGVMDLRTARHVQAGDFLLHPETGATVQVLEVVRYVNNRLRGWRVRPFGLMPSGVSTKCVKYPEWVRIAIRYRSRCPHFAERNRLIAAGEGIGMEEQNEFNKAGGESASRPPSDLVLQDA
jgi:hypothetical protein